MVILEQGAPKMIKKSMEQRIIMKRSMKQEKILEQEEKLKRSREHRKVKREKGQWANN